MKPLKFYTNKKLLNKQEIFQYLLSTMIKNNHIWSYLIDWKAVGEKTFRHNNNIEKLNILLNAKDIDKEFNLILKNDPDILKVFPALLATRDEVITIFDDMDFNYLEFNFKNIDQQKIDMYREFFQKSGLLELFSDKSITCMKSYLKGVEAGLNSNARKNRSGTINQELLHKILKRICSEQNIICIPECTKSNKELKDNNIILPTDKTSRRYDFALITQNKKLVLIETNFYSGGGSKLKSTCGEYKSLQNFLRGQNTTFIWITDGGGWSTTKPALEETFLDNDYILNLFMSRNGALEEILKKV
jgi:type II restriction enzyme